MDTDHETYDFRSSYCDLVLDLCFGAGGVRFIQLYHRGWDHHGNLPERHPKIAKEVDQGSAALVQDLKQRGMLEDTLVIWGGEFGRTVYKQGNPTKFGRDHHPRCFSIWMAGGGIRPGTSYGETDDWCYNIVDCGMHVHGNVMDEIVT